MNAKKCCRVVHAHHHRTIYCQHFGWNSSPIRPFSIIKVVYIQALDTNPSSVRPTSTPNNHTKHRKHQNKPHHNNQTPATPGKLFLPIKIGLLPQSHYTEATLFHSSSYSLSAQKPTGTCRKTCSPTRPSSGDHNEKEIPWDYWKWGSLALSTIYRHRVSPLMDSGRSTRVALEI